MAWTTESLKILEENYQQGVTKVKFRDREVEYRSLDEMRQLINEAKRDLSTAARKPIYPVTQRGYQ